jgi:hypothetical protein
MFISHILLLQIKFVFMLNNTIFLWCKKGRKLPSISCDSQNSWIHFRYIHLDFHVVIYLIYFLRMCFYMCFIKLNLFCITYDFFSWNKLEYILIYHQLIKQSNNIPLCLYVCRFTYIKMNKPQQRYGPCSSMIWKCTLILFSHRTSKLHNSKLVKLASNPVTNLSCCNFCSV